MKYLFELSQDNLPLARAEVEALAGKGEALGNLLIIDSSKNFADRLALTRAVYELLFRCRKHDLIGSMKSFDWNNVFRESFRLALHDSKDYSPKDLADYIYDSLKFPKVDLKSPETRFDLFFIEDEVIAVKLAAKIKRDYNPRKAHNLPSSHPTTMHPRITRALINLSGVEKEIVDVMCGSGGFLLEAVHMGLKAKGFDIDYFMLKRARANTKEYSDLITLERADATRIKEKFDYIVTDLPYGKNTKKQDLLKLYTGFLQNLQNILKTRAVIVFPDKIDCQPLIEKTSLKIKQEFTQYVHHSLTRKIVVLEPKI